MRALNEEFRLPVRRLALIELSGWAFLLGPVGIDEGETAQDRLDLLLGGSKLLKNMGVLPRAAVLSGGRIEDRGRCERVDRSLLEGDQIAARALKAGIDAEHKGILIENCRGDDIVMAPEGISGNLIFRTLMLLCGAQSYGAPAMMEKIFIDSSRARSGFSGPVMLAGAMAGMRKEE
jgi:predicted methyltransferase MtxX (methanogen marker protein 4)